MPDIDYLMQEWPADVEQQLGESGLPIADLDCDLPRYVDIVCSKYIMSGSRQKPLKYSHWRKRDLSLLFTYCSFQSPGFAITLTIS